MKQEDFNNLPDLFAERTNGGHKGSGVLQFGFKSGANKIIELLGPRVEHAKDCAKGTVAEITFQHPNFSGKTQHKHECTCGLDTIMKGFPLHG